MSDETPVILRRWNGDPKTVIALFPTIPADYHGELCQSYEHIGQHGGADIPTVIKQTSPVDINDKDAKELLQELKNIGYDNMKLFKRNQHRFKLDRYYNIT